MDSIRKGDIRGFSGSWGSGIGHLIIDDAEYGEVFVPCENGATVRALEAAFDDVIAESHSIDPEGGHVGQTIFYSVDGIGLLEWFLPDFEASPELVEAYENQREDEEEEVNHGDSD